VVTLGPTAQATLVTMNHWILTLLDLTNINMPHVLYDKKKFLTIKIFLVVKIFCKNTKLKLNEFMKLTYARSIINDLFAIVYVVNIAFNINIKKSMYVDFEMKQHLNFFFNAKYINFFPKAF
jgi:hypothetical protein